MRHDDVPKLSEADLERFASVIGGMISQFAGRPIDDRSVVEFAIEVSRSLGEYVFVVPVEPYARATDLTLNTPVIGVPMKREDDVSLKEHERAMEVASSITEGTARSLVWIVEEYNYEDSNVAGVYESREAAEASVSPMLVLKNRGDNFTQYEEPADSSGRSSYGVCVSLHVVKSRRSKRSP